MLIPYKGGQFKVTQKLTLGVHNGLDIVGLSSKNLVAICDGVVKQSRIVTDRNNKTWEWGNYVTLQATDGTLITYAHMSKRLVSAGDTVSKGDIIGVEGNTGYSFGSHCHLEVRTAANVVTGAVNTPKYTGIPNIVQTINAKEEEQEVEDMTREETSILITEALRTNNEELIALFDKKIDEVKTLIPKEKVYHTWDEIRALGGDMYAVAYAMHKAGYFNGESSTDLNCSKTKLENIVITGRALMSAGLLDF